MPPSSYPLSHLRLQQQQAFQDFSAPLRSENERNQAEFKILWQKEYNEIRKKISKIPLIAAPDLIRMLQEALSALEMQNIKPKFLSGAFSGYSLTCQRHGSKETVGIIWTEDANMLSFFHVMKACQKSIDKDPYLSLWLIRAAAEGNPKLASSQIHKQIFKGNSRHHHVRPDLSSVHDLATYSSLVDSALAHELVIAGKSLSLKELQFLIRESKLLHECSLLQDLGVVQKISKSIDEKPQTSEQTDKGTSVDQPRKKPQLVKLVKPDHKKAKAKDFVLNLVITQQFMGLQAVVQGVQDQFPTISESDVHQLIQELCQQKRVAIPDPKAKPEAQLIFWIP